VFWSVPQHQQVIALDGLQPVSAPLLVGELDFVLAIGENFYNCANLAPYQGFFWDVDSQSYDIEQADIGFHGFFEAGFSTRQHNK